jgi:hypothetical protein
MPVVAKTLRPCPEPKATISERTLVNDKYPFYGYGISVNPAESVLQA